MASFYIGQMEIRLKEAQGEAGRLQILPQQVIVQWDGSDDSTGGGEKGSYSARILKINATDFDY